MVEVIPSATTALSRDSMAPSMAMVRAGWNTFCIISKLMFGRWGTGNPLGIWFFMPMVTTPWPFTGSSQPSTFTRTVATTMATREPGTFVVIFGHKIHTARATSPTITAYIFTVSKEEA